MSDAAIATCRLIQESTRSFTEVFEKVLAYRDKLCYNKKSCFG